MGCCALAVQLCLQLTTVFLITGSTLAGAMMGSNIFYGCGTVLAGFVTAILFEAKNVKKQDESLKHD